MKKKPTFPLPYLEFLGMTAGMSAIEKGAFISLLCLQARDGSLPVEEGDLMKIIGCTGYPAIYLNSVLPYFPIVEEGGERIRRNPDLAKSLEISAKRKAAAQVRWDEEKKQKAPSAPKAPRKTIPAPSSEFTPPTRREVQDIAGASGIAESAANQFFDWASQLNWTHEGKRIEVGSGLASFTTHPPDDSSAAQISRIEHRIREIQTDPEHRNRAHGFTAGKKEHYEKTRKEWASYAALCRDEFIEKFPEEWAEFQADTFADGVEGVEETALLEELSKKVPADIWPLEKWAKAVKKEWRDPAKLTPDAESELRDCNLELKRLRRNASE